jgi:hypothetical protein
MFFLRVNGLAATSMISKKAALTQAQRGLEVRPDAVVELFKYDSKTDTDVFVSRVTV